MRTLTILMLLIPAMAGCLAGEGDPNESLTRVGAAAAAIGEPIVMAHDHNDHSLHTASHNVEFISWSDLGMTLGDNGFANFVLWSDDDERLAYVAVDGDDEGGFVIVDIADPAAPQVLGQYMVPGSSIQEVRVTPDGRFAVMNMQDLTTSQEGAQSRAEDDSEYCGICIHVVNVQDRTAPSLSSLFPVELLGTHNMDFQEQDGDLYLYYVGQPLSYTPGDPSSQPGNHVYIAAFVEQDGQALLVAQGDFRHDNTDDAGDRSFPHDVIVDVHPITGQHIAYLSHWDGGAITFDVSDPMAPVELGQQAEFAPSEALAIHWVKQEDWVRPDGRVYAWSAPEIGALGSGTGVIRGYDITDPADIQQVGTWELPGAGPDGVFIERAFIMSPHTVNVDPETGIAAVSHYHAGLWLLDVSDPTDPRHVGFYQPHGEDADPYDGPIWWKKPNFDPTGFGPNVYMARWDDRGDDTILWVTDRGTGLYALRYTGDVAMNIAE